jgi:hypothetical protein
MHSTPPQRAKIVRQGLRLEEAVDQRGTGLSLGRQAMPAVVSDPAKQLQRRTADCFPAQSEEAFARAEGDPDLGWIAYAQEPENEAVLERQHGWLQVEMLPGYSPDLKPVEDLWSNSKGQELANYCVAGLGEAEDGVCNGMARVRQSMLPFSFLHHAGLFF